MNSSLLNNYPGASNGGSSILSNTLPRYNGGSAPLTHTASHLSNEGHSGGELLALFAILGLTVTLFFVISGISSSTVYS